MNGPLQKQTHSAQVAALPLRHGKAGAEVLLITSRESKRWIVPKGWPMKGRKDYQAAEIEALEEAGVKGKIGRHPIGAYTYAKRLADHVEPCRVMVYLLDVDELVLAWPERDLRLRRWFSIEDAADTIEEPALASMIRKLASDRSADPRPATA